MSARGSRGGFLRDLNALRLDSLGELTRVSNMRRRLLECLKKRGYVILGYIRGLTLGKVS